MYQPNKQLLLHYQKQVSKENENNFIFTRCINYLKKLFKFVQIQNNKDMKTENETENKMINEVDELGLQIESELNEMYDTGQVEWDIEDIRKVGKRTYDLIFDNYEDDEENGVETSHFSLLEKEDDEMVYKLIKK